MLASSRKMGGIPEGEGREGRKPGIPLNRLVLALSRRLHRLSGSVSPGLPLLAEPFRTITAFGVTVQDLIR